MASRVYDFNLAAAVNASQRFDVRGAYVKVLTAPGGAVAVRTDTGEEVELKAGQGFRALPNGKGELTPFLGLQVRNLTANANAGTIFIGDQSFEDSRITGDVSIIDAVSSTCQLYSTMLANVGFNVQTFITPAQNVRGVIVRQSTVETQGGAGGTVIVRLYGAPVVPPSIFPSGNPAILLNAFSNGGSTYQSNNIYDSRRMLPPGWGLYYTSQVTVAVATNATGQCSAEIL